MIFSSEEGLPKYNTALSPIIPERFGTGNFQINNMEIITSYFSKEQILKNGKFFSPKQGLKQIIKSLLYKNSKFICGFWESHLPYPLLKSTFDLLWEKENGNLRKNHQPVDLGIQQIQVFGFFKYWQIASGQYAIGDSKIGGLFSLDDANSDFWNHFSFEEI